MKKLFIGICCMVALLVLAGNGRTAEMGVQPSTQKGHKAHTKTLKSKTTCYTYECTDKTCDMMTMKKGECTPEQKKLMKKKAKTAEPKPAK